MYIGTYTYTQPWIRTDTRLAICMRRVYQCNDNSFGIQTENVFCREFCMASVWIKQLRIPEFTVSLWVYAFNVNGSLRGHKSYLIQEEKMKEDYSGFICTIRVVPDHKTSAVNSLTDKTWHILKLIRLRVYTRSQLQLCASEPW